MFDYTARALGHGDIPEGSEYTFDIPRGVAASESLIPQGRTRVRDRMHELSSEWPPKRSIKMSQVKVYTLVVNHELDVRIFSDATIPAARGQKPSSTAS